MPARKYHGHHAHRYIDWVPSEPGMADLGGLQISQDHNPRKCAPPLPSSPQLLLGTRVTELGQFVWKWGGPTAPTHCPLVAIQDNRCAWPETPVHLSPHDSTDRRVSLKSTGYDEADPQAPLPHPPPTPRGSLGTLASDMKHTMSRFSHFPQKAGF